MKRSDGGNNMGKIISFRRKEWRENGAARVGERRRRKKKKERETREIREKLTSESVRDERDREVLHELLKKPK